LAESALYHASLLEAEGFYDIILSVKASSVTEMIKANKILADRTDYPLHLGVTEAGGGDSAIIKSSVGIGSLLSLGIGDTVRVSLTQDPVDEVPVAREILKSLGLLPSSGMDIVSCPTCGRTKVDLISILGDFKSRVKSEGLDKLNIKVAIMGCAVNGPGEAREADLGIACGVGEGLIFKSGEIIRKVSEDSLVDELISEIRLLK
jgi:(E)-4-hydroxy-3-methylbut-2-enyl-diphosphate synthase